MMTAETTIRRILFTAVLGAAFATLAPAPALGAVSNCLPDARQASGAQYRICMPEAGRWNGNLVLFAHGYVAFNEPVQIPEDQLTLPDGTPVPQLINALGFAFATTSYSKNGLAVVEGIEDLRDLVNIFAARIAPPLRIFIVGPSEGGIVTALAIERHPETFDAGLAACGPIGDFRRQINYIGDFRVVFDAFFPGLLPGSATQVPDELIQDFDSVYVPRIQAAIAAYPGRAQQVLAVTRAPGGADPTNTSETFTSVLWYAVFATNDATAELGGQPFDNRRRLYTGSTNDLLLNLVVERADADPAALQTINADYQTSGNLIRPLVTLHTLGDQIIPYWHEPLYTRKVNAAGADALYAHIPIASYGHCNFTAPQVLVAFAVMLKKVGAQPLSDDVISLALPSDAEREAYARMWKTIQ